MSRRGVAKRNLPKSFRVWLNEFKGKDVVSGYRKHFHTTRSCAILELRLLGVSFTEEEIAEAKTRQVAAAMSRQARWRQKLLRRESDFPTLRWGVDYDDTFAFIAGFTSGGAAYGTTWEEAAEAAGTEMPRMPFDSTDSADSTNDDYDPFTD